MEPPPKTRPALFGGLAKLLHLHQLPKAGESTPHTSPISARPPIAPVRNDSLSIVVQKRPSPIPHAVPPRVIIPAPKPIPPKKETPVKPASKSAPTNPPPAPAPTPTPTPVSAPVPIIPHDSKSDTLDSDMPAMEEKIITDYDRIFEMVKSRQKIKLDEIARLLSLKEERVAQELQTLEDNGLIEVKYPAFGEPLICYKPQDV